MRYEIGDTLRMMIELSIVQKIAILILPLLFAISMHEVAHGWVASWCGDQTARLSGRLSLNPIKHIDLIGTIVVPLLMFVMTGFIFGWAKPVPIDTRNMRHPRRDEAIVALAGPLANLFMAIIWGAIARFGVWTSVQGNDWIGLPLTYMGSAGITINVVLAVLNLIPLPPLDGSKIIGNILPRRFAYYLYRLEPYSLLILILLLVSGVLSSIMGPPLSFLINLIGNMFGLD